MEQLRSSQQIKDLTPNGFADWIPLESKSYINIERNSKCERSGNILNTTKLRTFDDDIDQVSLEAAISEIFQEEGVETALERLFPGPIALKEFIIIIIIFNRHLQHLIYLSISYSLL